LRVNKFSTVRSLLALCCTTCLLCFAKPGSATESLPAGASEKGLAIALEADRRETGFGDSTANLTMLMEISSSVQIQREMRQLTLEVDEDGDKVIMVFDRPRDIKGTAILTFSHKVSNDDQWLYLPALKRVKRISAADKSGPFMGSEFAYEDLSSDEVEKYNYRYLKDEELEGELFFVVERIPVNTKSGYTRQVTWVDQNEYRLRRVDYYDRKGDLLKTMVLVDYQQYLNKYWRADQMTMTNHQTGKSTTLKFDNYQFQTGLTELDFSRGALSRIR
jgi:outer membrane lipoprotein-sorting protein